MKRSWLYILLLCVSVTGCADRDPDVDSGQLLHRGGGEEPESLDIHKSTSTEAGHVQRDFGEGLVGYTPDGELRAAAAASWKLSDDGKVYTFNLRPEARWSNGDPVTAQDFVFSYRRLVDPQTAALYTDSVNSVANAAAILRGDASPSTLGVTAVADHVLEISLTQPVPYFLALLAHPSMFPLHRSTVEELGDQFARPGNLVGNGAYQLHSWVVGSYIELERNQYYWDNENTSIDRVRHYVTPQPSSELNRYRAGELHITRAIPPELFQQMLIDRPDEVRISPALGIYYFGFNMEREPFASNQKLRQALSMAVDRDAIIDLIGRGEEPAYSWVPDGTFNYDPQRYSWAELNDDERIRRAQQLFEEAGYGDGNPLEVSIRYNTHDTHQKIVVAMQSMWRSAFGIEATLINEDLQMLLANVQQGNMDVFRLSWNGDYNDAHTFLAMQETGNSSNYTRYSRDEYDELMARAAAQTDLDKRKLYLEEAERLMLRDYPVIPIYFRINRSMVSTKVEGWGDNVLDYHYSQHLSFRDD